MDPLSPCASAVAVLTIAGQSCSLLYRFFRGIHDAPGEIHTQSGVLHGLSCTFTSLQALCRKESKNLELSEHFPARLADCVIIDLRLAEARVRNSESLLTSGHTKRARARLKWTLSSND